MSYRARQSRAFIWICVLAALLIAIPMLAFGKPWNTPYDRYFDLPGARVKTLTDHDGTQIRTVTLPHGVSIQQRREAGQVTTITTDLNGPVLCFQDRYVDLLVALEGCRNLRSRAATRRLENGLHRVNHFVADNWVEPITMAEIEAWVASRRAQMLGQAGLYGRKGTVCRDPHIAEAIERIAAYSDAEFEAELDALLAIPRLPAMAPCH